MVDSNLANVPKRAQDHYAQALELAKSRDHKGAIAQLQLAIAEHPKFMLALNEMGVQFLRLNQLDKADESLRAALEIAPDAFAPLMNRGIVLVSMTRFADAETILRQARYNSKGDKKKAAEELETYLRVYPNAPDAERLRETIRQMRTTESKPAK